MSHTHADRLTDEAQAIAAAIARRQPTRGDAFVLHRNHQPRGNDFKILAGRALLRFGVDTWPECRRMV